MLLFVFALCESFCLPSCSQICWLPLFIAVLVALVCPQLADLQLRWLLLQLKFTGAWKREGTGGQFGLVQPHGDWLSVLPEDLLICVGTAATYALQWGSVKERLCNAKGYSSLLSWRHYDRAVPSCAFCLSEKSGSACKTEGTFWVQFDVIVFWWCISIVLQEFIYQNPNVLSAYCNKNCQWWPNCLTCKRFKEIKWQVLRLLNFSLFFY